MAAHLLLIPPASDSCVVGTLRRAADQAFARGSPDSAVSYLERCLHEPPPEAERADVLLQLGTAAQLLDAAKSADYLTAAMATTEDPQHKAAIAEILAVTLFNAGRGTEASQVVSQGIQVLVASFLSRPTSPASPSAPPDCGLSFCGYRIRGGLSETILC